MRSLGLALVVLGLGCSSSSSAGDSSAAGAPSAGTGGADSPAAGASGVGGSASPPVKLYPDFLPPLAVGDYWDIARKGDVNVGYRITLVEEATVEGVAGFRTKYQLLWAFTLNGQEQSYEDPYGVYEYFSFADGVLQVKNRAYVGGGPWVTVFSEYGTWKGGLFFGGTGNPAITTVVPQAMKNDFMTDADTLGFRWVANASQCEYYPDLGQTICANGGDSQPSESADEQEFYKSGVGFFGRKFHGCVGTTCTDVQTAVMRSGPGPAPACAPTAADPNGRECCLQVLPAAQCP